MLSFHNYVIIIAQIIGVKKSDKGGGKRMGYQTENTLQKRKDRVRAAINLREGDRVPFAPKVNLVYAQDAGISNYEAYSDWRNMKPGVEKFLSKYEVDMFWAPADYPIKVMEVLGTTAIKWPGQTWGIDRNMGFQVTDASYLSEDEYDELIKDPSHYFMTKLYPRRHAKLQALSRMSWKNVIEFGHYAGMAQFADPDVRQALLTLMAAGDQAAQWLADQNELCQTALAYETPLGCILGQNAPYDMLADGIRGYLDVPMDLFEIPEKVLAAIDVMTDMALENVEGIAAAGMDYCFMPLHGGTDDFMSYDTYMEYYLPSLRKVIEKELELGITPYIFFEGKYHTRLEILRDEFPKGIIAMFEQIDIAKAKKVLGDHMCICGNLAGATLAYGKPEEVIEETKKMLDICAPGGGFIMDCSIVMDHYNEANFDAWYETTLKYGNY